jgi:hypothetical protein
VLIIFRSLAYIAKIRSNSIKMIRDTAEQRGQLNIRTSMYELSNEYQRDFSLVLDTANFHLIFGNKFRILQISITR